MFLYIFSAKIQKCSYTFAGTKHYITGTVLYVAAKLAGRAPSPRLQDLRFSDIWICGIGDTADRVLMTVRDA